MLNICLTYDYEIFFGKNNASVQEILFNPTETLLEVLEETGVRGTFFADVCSVTQNKRYKCYDYVEGFEKQLKNIADKGHDVQLHIHPHWLNSVYSDGEWFFDKDTYCIHSLGFDRNKKDNVHQIISDGKKYLESLLADVMGYECIAYRAGGFVIQPHDKLVKELIGAGIKIDSSIAPMLSVRTNTHKYDFRHKLPNVNWRVSHELPWYEDAVEGGLYEIPIATERKRILSYVLRRIYDSKKIKLDLGTPKGSYIGEDAKQTSICKLISMVKYIIGYNALSLDAYSYVFLYELLDRYYRRHRCDKINGSVALIGHPKLINREYLENMKKLIDMIKTDGRYQFATITEAYTNG